MMTLAVSPPALSRAESVAPAPAVTARAREEDALRGLFERARSGDDEALNALCAAMRPRLFRVAKSVVKDADEADDIAQEALVRAVTRRFSFLGLSKGGGSVGGWMSRIALNLAKNRVRDQGRRRELLRESIPAEMRTTHSAPAPSPDDAVDGGRIRLRIESALDALPKRQQEVLRLRLLGELSFADIAETLDIKETNARVSASQGMKTLRTTLADVYAALSPDSGGQS